MGRLYDLVTEHQNTGSYHVSLRAIAKASGVAPATIHKWKTITRLPEPEHLRAVARQIGLPYRVLLEAALYDTGHLGEHDGTTIRGAGLRPAYDEVPWPENMPASVRLWVYENADNDELRAYVARGEVRVSQEG